MTHPPFQRTSCRCVVPFLAVFCTWQPLAFSPRNSVALLQDYQRLLASQSVRRLNPAKVSESAALKTKLVDTIAFLESLAVKDSNEKDLFFKRLPATLPSLPLPVVQKKVTSVCVSLHDIPGQMMGMQPIRVCSALMTCVLTLQLLPMLASALEYGGAPSLALGALLQIGKTLDAGSFTAQVVPVLSKLFASNDRTIRRSLLESIDTYGKHFTEVNSLPLQLPTRQVVIGVRAAPE